VRDAGLSRNEPVIFVGTCGYSYKDWIGPFYPPTVRKEEMLPYYASIFHAVEIDASFYGILAPNVTRRMITATPDRFRFCFKAPQTVTHAPDLTTPHVHPDANLFTESLRPMVDAGKLGAVLLQFPNGFRPAPAAVAYFERIVEAFEDLPLVAEFRNGEWQTARTIELLSELNVGWCNVDMPRYESLMLPSSDVTGSVGYLRFHGRNAEKWWTGDNATRYDYLYTAEELVPWADRVAEVQEQAEQTYAFFNNHARGNAVRNAEVFAELVRERYGSAADAVVERLGRYPAQGSLFE
jgi:uncharacterized protein YecE (DUF72 family)